MSADEIDAGRHLLPRAVLAIPGSLVFAGRDRSRGDRTDPPPGCVEDGEIDLAGPGERVADARRPAGGIGRDRRESSRRGDLLDLSGTPTRPDQGDERVRSQAE